MGHGNIKGKTENHNTTWCKRLQFLLCKSKKGERECFRCKAEDCAVNRSICHQDRFKNLSEQILEHPGVNSLRLLLPRCAAHRTSPCCRRGAEAGAVGQWPSAGRKDGARGTPGSGPQEAPPGPAGGNAEHTNAHAIMDVVFS